MEVREDLIKIINDPNTVDFVARYTKQFADYAASNPDITLTQILRGRYVIGYANKNNFKDLSTPLGTGFISSLSTVLGTLEQPELTDTGIYQVQNQPFLNLTGRGVLIGIVDTGIDYTNEAFIYEDGTSKIRYLYDESDSSGIPPGDFYIGTEYTNEQINAALKLDDPYSMIPQKDTSGHGTFLSSLMSGRNTDDFTSMAPDSELIVVKLKKARSFYYDRYGIPSDQENAFESSAVMLGIEYILQKAEELDSPVAICLGLGTNFGSHDGFSLFEEFLGNVGNLKGVCLCIAAGNESQAGHHVECVIPLKGDSCDINVNVGKNVEDIYITIWSFVPDRVSISVRSPTGELISRVPARPGNIQEVQLVLEKSKVRIEYHFPVEGSGGQNTIVKIKDPTPGIWVLTLHGDIILNGVIHAWLPMKGFISDNVKFIGATPYYTITIPGTTVGLITCGAYNSFNNSIYLETSWGPTRNGISAPDFVAPGVNISGFYPNGFGTMSGTSVATAITTGASALLLQWGIVEENDLSLSTYQIRAYLIRGATRSEALIYPNYQWGYGTINLMQTFHYMREI